MKEWVGGLWGSGGIELDDREAVLITTPRRACNLTMGTDGVLYPQP